MGSRIMHLIIADQVGKYIQIEDKQSFLLGGIAPDAAFSRDLKNASHFYEGSIEDGTRLANYNRFVAAYFSSAPCSYKLGYLTHLIADDVWLQHIYFKNDFKARIEKDPGFLEKWHADFKVLNGQLIEWFDCHELKNALSKANPYDNTIKEIQINNLQLFIDETLTDFTYSQNSLTQELQVYSLEQIITYIDIAARKAVKVISEQIGELTPSK